MAGTKWPSGQMASLPNIKIEKKHQPFFHHHDATSNHSPLPPPPLQMTKLIVLSPLNEGGNDNAFVGLTP